MKNRANLMVMGVALAAATFALATAARAATIFDANFDGSHDTTTGVAPYAASASALPVLNTAPTSTPVGVTLENAASKGGFTLGSGNFAYFSTNSSGNSRIYFAPNASDRNDSGTYTFTFDYRRDSTVTGQNGGMNVYFASNGSNPFGDILISNSTGLLTIYRLVGGSLTKGDAVNFAADTDYTVKGVLVLNGTSSTLDFYAAKKGDPLTKLDNGKSSTIEPGTSAFKDVDFLIGKDSVVGLGVDNVTVTYDAIPEPAGGAMLLMGGLGLLGMRKRNR